MPILSSPSVRPWTLQSGNIVIKKSSDDSTVETIDVTGSKVTGTGTTTITINPASVLTGLTGYYLNIAATAFDDASVTPMQELRDATTLNFSRCLTSYPHLLIKKTSSAQLKLGVTSHQAGQIRILKSVQGRIDWLNRHKGSNQTSYQGIQINFADTLINKIMNSTPGAALRDIDAVDTAASLIGQ